MKLKNNSAKSKQMYVVKFLQKTTKAKSTIFEKINSFF